MTLVTLAFILIFIAIFISKRFEGEDGKLMPISTTEGKIARVLLIPIILIGLAAIMQNYLHDKSYTHSPVVILASLIAIGIPVVAYIKFKRKQK